MLLTQTPHLHVPNPKKTGEHPFLITRKQDFPALQARAEHSPWREQKEDALHDARAVVYTPTARIDVRAITLARILSTTALAYILDPENRTYYVERIVEHFRAFDLNEPGSITAEMRANPNKMLWIYGVPTGNAFFQAVLALDVIHDELPADDLHRLEAVLRDGPARYFMETKLTWRQGTLAAKAIWAVYERDAGVYEPIVNEWRDDVLASITPDGIFGGGTGYADARWTFADREHKALFGEILAHAGILPDWYSEPRLGHFQEWLTGYAFTPFKSLWTFGDGAPGMFFGRYQPGPERAYRYSELAGRYATWLRGDVRPPVGLGSYVLAEQPPAVEAASPSRIFPDGGAWLKETSLNPHALSGALWNLKTLKDAHAHKETNSLCLAAYGELLMRASGYNGWDTPEKGFSWDYIHDRAISGNTVLFDYAIPKTEAAEYSPPFANDHVAKTGAGITAGLITGVVDYARGDSGAAIPNGRHVRNFIFVHPSDGAAGYYATIDELHADAPHATGHVIWHPSSDRYVETAPDQEYTWTMQEFGPKDVNLTVFLGTPPQRTHVCRGVLANWGKGIVGQYLVGDYATGVTGKKNVVTVLFPHDAAHAKATMSRIAKPGLTGVAIRQGDITDTLVGSDATQPIQLGKDITLHASAGYVRRTADGIATVWGKDVRVLRIGDMTVDCTAPATLLYRKGVLNVNLTSPGRLTLGGMRVIPVGDVPMNAYQNEPDQNTVSLEAGNYEFQLLE